MKQCLVVMLPPFGRDELLFGADRLANTLLKRSFCRRSGLTCKHELSLLLNFWFQHLNSNAGRPKMG